MSEVDALLDRLSLQLQQGESELVEPDKEPDL
jgi:hypothetical protein